MKLIEVGAAGIVLAAVALSGPAAQGADLKVLAATPMTGVVNAMSRQFEDQGRHKLEVKFVSGPIVKREIDAGANVDLAISITRVIDELIKDGKLVAETRVAVAYAVVGLGVRAGARSRTSVPSRPSSRLCSMPSRLHTLQPEPAATISRPSCKSSGLPS